MNKDFMLLNDNTVEVTNEEGLEINRGDFKTDNVKDILLAENKIEIVENIEKQLKKEQFENEKVILLSNCMLVFSTVLLILSPIIGLISGMISYPNNYIIAGIINSIYWFASAIIPIGAAKIYWNIAKLIFKKKRKNTEMKFTKTNNMKKEYEKELEVAKEKVVTNTLEIEPLVKVSLEEETINVAKQVKEELKQFTDENIKQKGKTRIRKR